MNFDPKEFTEFEKTWKMFLRIIKFLEIRYDKDDEFFENFIKTFQKKLKKIIKKNIKFFKIKNKKKNVLKDSAYIVLRLLPNL